MEQLSPQLMHKLVFTVLMHGLNDSQTNLALKLLTDALSHPNGQVREMAIVAIADLTVPPVKRAQALTLGLKDESAKVRRRAARALADLGAAAQCALAQLNAGLNDPDMSVRRDCAGAISRLGPSAAVAATGLISMLVDPEGRTRAIASVALKRMGPAAIPALVAKSRTGPSEVRVACASLLRKINSDEGDVVDFAPPPADPNDRDFRINTDEELIPRKGPPSGIAPAPASV